MRLWCSGWQRYDEGRAWRFVSRRKSLKSRNALKKKVNLFN